ncbi:hypothetical protein CNMCM6106_002396 [Aspergillus hiratsukae]|uniref:Protein kinase domain-containing protein n=1 Tax=Aspergillus hiratsukae TaxID=1194566 RepID=A0A8H6Q448_9EURO|nr:hypothetical protein CNMCM6106_002396 [Aspergillus hiratsukae]
MNVPGYRGTVLPMNIRSQEPNPRLGLSTSGSEQSQAQLDTVKHQAPKTLVSPVSSLKAPNTIRKKTKRIAEETDTLDTSSNERGRFPVRPAQGEKNSDEGEVWWKYHRFLEADQAGPGIIAHDNSIDHLIVVIKEIRVHASENQRRQLYRVLNEKPTNIVHLTDLFLGTLSVHAVYEPLETSMHQIQATSRRDITEIELAIIGKEASALILHGLEYIHNELGIVYGQLNTRNILLSHRDCHLKLANIAASILKHQQGSYSGDIAAVGTLLVSMKEPGTSGRNPESLQLENPEERTMARAAEYFRGHAKILLRHLEFHSPLFASRAFDPTHVERLKNVFQQDACARSEPCNFISAVIDDDTLNQAIIQSSATVEALRSETEMPFLLLPNGYRLRCLYGRHRVEAAKEVLIPGDSWWSVTLYHDSIPRDLRRQLCIHRDGDFSSGDVYRNLRHCELTTNTELAFWLSKLSKRSRRDLVSTKKRYPIILAALDKLLPFPGLWADFSFGFLRRLIEISCPVEITGYLDGIYRIWSTLFEGMNELVDLMSVRLVENLVPQQSCTDRNEVRDTMENGILFPHVVGSTARENLLNGLLGIHGRILSLHSLVQDSLLWHPCAQAIKQLVPGRCDDLRHALLPRFHGDGAEWLIQTGENAVEALQAGLGDSPQPAIAAYVQLWLFAIRYIESLTRTNLPGSRDERNSERHSLRPTRRESSHQLGVLARQLGFKSHQIDSFCGQSAMKPSARAYLLARRPQTNYVYPTQWENSASSRIVQLIGVPKPITTYTVVVPPTATNSSGKVKRCGLPSLKSYLKDRESIYIPHIYSPDQQEGENLTSFAILRDMAFVFFGRNLFPGGVCPWWTKDSCSVHCTPVDCDPHPPGTPDRDTLMVGQTDTQMALDLIPLPSLGPGLEDSSCIAPLNQTSTLIPLPPMAPGFEDSSRIAPLNQTAHISHHRQFDEMLCEFAKYRQTSPAVIYFFKTREYCKFDFSDPHFNQEVTAFVNTIANNHYFFGNGGALNPKDVLSAIRSIPLVLACTEFAHFTPQFDLRQYVAAFDAHTGKRPNGEESDQPDAQNGRRLRERQETGEDSEL